MESRRTPGLSHCGSVATATSATRRTGPERSSEPQPDIATVTAIVTATRTRPLTLALSGRPRRFQARGRRNMAGAPGSHPRGWGTGPLERVVRQHLALPPPLCSSNVTLGNIKHEQKRPTSHDSDFLVAVVQVNRNRSLHRLWPIYIGPALAAYKLRRGHPCAGSWSTERGTDGRGWHPDQCPQIDIGSCRSASWR